MNRKPSPIAAIGATAQTIASRPIAPQRTVPPVASVTPTTEKTRIWIVEVGILKRLKNVVTAKATPITTTSASIESGAPVKPRSDALLDRVARERRAEKRERRHEDQRLPRADRPQRVRHPHDRARVVRADAPGEPEREHDQERSHRCDAISSAHPLHVVRSGAMSDREPPGYDDWFDEPEPPTLEQGRGGRHVVRRPLRDGRGRLDAAGGRASAFAPAPARRQRRRSSRRRRSRSSRSPESRSSSPSSPRSAASAAARLRPRRRSTPRRRCRPPRRSPPRSP